MVDIHCIRQKEPKGLDHAIHCAKSFVENEPFAILLGDDIGAKMVLLHGSSCNKDI